MAQRSARARSKLDKITAANGGPPPAAAVGRKHGGIGGIGGGLSFGARLGSGGLLTPSASSVSGSSTTRNSAPTPRNIAKGALRSFFDAQGEKLRGRLQTHHTKRENEAGSFYAGLGGGVRAQDGQGFALGLGTIGEERVQVRRWEGHGSRGEGWDGGGEGKKDLELWFPDGDTLVYLSEKPMPSSRNPQQQGLYKPPPPQPSFRLRSSALRKTESPYLVSLLEESVRERPMTPPVEPEIFPEEQTEEQLMDFEYQLRRTRTLEMSSSATSETSVATEAGITYRLYFPAPSRHDKAMRHRYHLATRNFFAILFEKSLVGITLGQTLLDVMERIDRYLFTGPSPMEYDLADRGISEIESPFGTFVTPATITKKTTHPYTVGILLQYLQAREFGDVRNWAEGAAGLLVWSERIGTDDSLRQSLPPHDQQRIEALWREAFVHCTGLLSSLQVLPEWREISPITKALIDRASLEIQVRVNAADARMAAFNFADMWPTTPSSTPPPPARLAFDRFQKFLMKHYAGRFGTWPPADGRFTRTLYHHLQRDFTTLYSYLVDQDAIWSSDPPPRAIVKPTNPAWSADDDSLRISELLAAFDEKENHPPIPHPFPLVPPTRTGTGTGFFSADRKQKGVGFSFTPGNPKHRHHHPPAGAAAAALALSESTNIESLRLSPTPNPLLEAFQAHEKSTPAHEIAPHDARKGRWVLIYGVLQTLASVAVDAPGVVWTEGVEYWVNPRLRDTPPWGKAGSVDERSHFRSHCWETRRGRSRSRRRGQLKLRRQRRVESSGDEGDDEMEEGGSPGEEEEGRGAGL